MSTLHCSVLPGTLPPTEVAWKVDEGVLEVVPGAGDAVSLAEFGDAEVHVEFSVPAEAGEGQAREPQR